MILAWASGVRGLGRGRGRGARAPLENASNSRGTFNPGMSLVHGREVLLQTSYQLGEVTGTLRTKCDTYERGNLDCKGPLCVEVVLRRGDYSGTRSLQSQRTMVIRHRYSQSIIRLRAYIAPVYPQDTLFEYDIPLCSEFEIHLGAQTPCFERNVMIMSGDCIPQHPELLCSDIRMLVCPSRLSS